MASGLNHGIRRSLPHFLGISCGFPIMVLIVSITIGTFIQQYPISHQIIKTIGILYLLYLAWLIATTKLNSIEGTTRDPFSFWQAFLFQWVNPKAWTVVTGAMAVFTSSVHTIYHSLISTLLFFIACAPCIFIWLSCGAALQRVLSKPEHQRYFNIAMALLLVASIIPVIGK